MTKPANAIAAFFATAERLCDAPCMHYKEGGQWHSKSWATTADEVRRLAAALRIRGLERGDRVAICASTSLEWTLADCAIMAAGGVVVPIYQSLTVPKISSILSDSLPKFIFVEDAHMGTRIEESRRSSGILDLIVIAMHEGGVRSKALAALIDEVPSHAIDRVVDIARGMTGADEATYVYTSGTTGEQKGAIISHGNIFAEVSAAEEIFDFSPDEIGLVCLPLAHVLGRLMQFYQLVHGCQSAYAESLDQLAANYHEIQPHFVCGVPRMLEKVTEMIRLKLETSSRVLKRIFLWSTSIGLTRSGFVQKHRAIPFSLRLRFVIADFLVFSRIREKLGGRMRCFICGGAPLHEEIAKFFHAAGLLVLEGYGLTETFAAATVNRPDDYHFGTVGKPLPGVEIHFAPDGEILVRGPTVFKGYRNLPEETRGAFDDAGWFLTGDIGDYSRDGFLRITGRKKDMIVTAGGKNIAPQMIEGIMSSCPYINHFMVYGDGKKYLSGLVTVNREAAEEYLRKKGETPTDMQTVVRHPAIRNLIEDFVNQQNKRLSPFETIKKIAIVDGDFSVASGELTPTLKVRRAFINEKYREELEALYR